MAITKPKEHDINQAGKRLLREVIEPLGWVVNDVQEDYGVDCNVQVFDGKSPTGEWFHVQLKSSASSNYSADKSFVSQELPIDHARHYALEMRQPVFLVHADVSLKKLYWYAPQLDRQLAIELSKSASKSITVRIPSIQNLPDTAAELLTGLEKIHLALAIRILTLTSTQSFADSFPHLPDQEMLRRAFQEKNDTLRLQSIRELFQERRFEEARLRTKAVLADPVSTIEIKFWAEIQLEAIDSVEMVHAGEPQSELPKMHLLHARTLQSLTASGPGHLKFYSLIALHAAQLEILTRENFSLFMAIKQHLEIYGNPMMALGLYARRSSVTRRLVSEYNRCVRLARYASRYPNRWVLGRALTNIARAIAPYLIVLRSEDNVEAEHQFSASALQVCKLSAWISADTGDSDGVVLAMMSALLTTYSVDSDAYRWAVDTAEKLVDPVIRADALARFERATRRWSGEPVEGDYQGNPVWQAIQNMASAIGIDVRNQNDPIVRGLKIAAKDDTPERVLKCCEHILVTQGTTGPVAREIQRLFNIGTAGSKVIHCLLHNFHVEGKELDTGYADFKRMHCDVCLDQKPRPKGWAYTPEEMRLINDRNRGFVASIKGTSIGFRYANED
jgi:Domain of unknown function (DUF4365)